ncbi:hypothetical protein [Streptomyces albogriseolus]|uniref:hypothetical protein n=1 Tax=Streptomyces albogriseolus TaxID=1887 RepID=UPI00369CA077
MNKFDLINVVLTSNLKADDKCLLIELIVRSDENWESYPGVKRLCKVRGIKHQKNFKGVQAYIPEYVSITKRGRKNYYVLDVEAIAALEEPELVVKETPSLAANSPSVADNTPAVADDSPSVEGANTTTNTSRDSSTNSSENAALRAAEEQGEVENKEEKEENSNDSVDSSFATNTSNPGHSSLESEVVSSALVVEDISSAAALGAEAEEIEYVLSASEHEGEARRLFADPSHRIGMEGALRARWCVMDATPAPVTVSKTGIDLEDW